MIICIMVSRMRSPEIRRSRSVPWFPWQQLGLVQARLSDVSASTSMYAHSPGRAPVQSNSSVAYSHYLVEKELRVQANMKPLSSSIINARTNTSTFCVTLVMKGMMMVMVMVGMMADMS